MTHRRPRQYSDQMQCAHCGKAWDVNDLSPPPCVSVGEVTLQRIRAMLAAPTVRRNRLTLPETSGYSSRTP
jgi:hypothetical protein